MENENAATKQPALLYLEPSAEWLNTWTQMRAGAPFNFLPAPMIGLLRPHEQMLEERIKSKLNALSALLPVTLTVKNTELMYSPFNQGSVLTFFFNESLQELRDALGPFGRNSSMYNDGKFTPHMILTQPIAMSKANRTFVSYIKTYTHGVTITMDSVGLQYGEDWNPNSLYEPHSETMTEALQKF